MPLPFLGAEFLYKLKKMQALTDEDEDNIRANISSKGEETQQPAWMRTLSLQCSNWLTVLPEVCVFANQIRLYLTPSAQSQNLQTQDRSGSESDPLERFFRRELSIGIRLLHRVRKDINMILLACNGEIKQTNHLRSLIASLTKGDNLFFLYTCHEFI